MSEKKQGYLDFDEYIVASEPHKRERAEAWKVAIGLQAVDGLQVSEYLKQTARRHIEGEITIDDAREMVKQYYVSKTQHDEDDEAKQEADRVSANITKIINERAFTFSATGLIAIHRSIFEGVFKHAGQLRTYDFTKEEHNELKNRYMLVNPPEEWKEPTSTRTSTRISTTVNKINPDSKLYTNNENIIELVRVIGNGELSIKQMMELKGLKHRQNFLDYHLEPSLRERYVRMKYPDRPNHPRQRYLLTAKGLALFQEVQ